MHVKVQEKQTNARSSWACSATSTLCCTCRKASASRCCKVAMVERKLLVVLVHSALSLENKVIRQVQLFFFHKIREKLFATDYITPN